MSRFRHYLSYGSTDQETARTVTGCYDGLIVPGTVAAFQAEGTKGFVLTLSARSKEPYSIDSRFPLFQNRPATWKKSHILLARIFGFENLLQSNRGITPEDLDSTAVDRIAQGWLDFNIDFETVQPKTFAKYAARLPEDDILVENRRSPEWIMPPYFMTKELTSPWRNLSDQIWDRSVQLLSGRPEASKLRRVVAAESADVWDTLLRSSEQKDVIGWVSRLDELTLNPAEVDQLVVYGRAIRAAYQREQSIFALYGGFFSVLLGRYGLKGSSHGVGYGEHRDHVELPSSGAPPARYYVPKLHRYIGVDIAAALWSEVPELVHCDCPECYDKSPVELDYHELMRHSVRTRDREIDEWSQMTTSDVCEQLRHDCADFQRAVDNLSAPRSVQQRAGGIYPHLKNWASALERIEQ